MKKTLFVAYCLAITIVFTLVAVVNAHTFFETITAFIYLPLVFYFTKELIRRTHPSASWRIRPAAADTIVKAPPFPITKKQLQDASVISPIPERGRVFDVDRRIFLKLIGSAGISIFMLALFTRKAQAAFFGSVPGPGTVALKNTAGTKIDPAEKHPTDPYTIAQIDDTSSATYAYYGFQDKSGNWYILQETISGSSQGNYRYVKGSSSFSTNWTNRATQTYDTFENTF